MFIVLLYCVFLLYCLFSNSLFSVIIAFILEGFMYQYSIMEDPPTPYAVNRLKTLGLDLLYAIPSTWT